MVGCPIRVIAVHRAIHTRAIRVNAIPGMHIGMED